MPDRIWNAAEYTRLSRDDGDKAESNSITSQKEIIRDYVRRHPEFVIVKEYADDGYSGVNFERPGFKQMMEDIKAKKIDCVICKDLSRFARNYIDAGRYLEKIFPFMGVRFIAINDNYDSCGEKAQSDALIVPFKNLINDAYCRDISVKIRSQLDIKRKMGDFIGAFAPYGYRKDEANRNRLVVDEEAARTVELIRHCETFRRAKGLPEISYEVGTEEVHGGLADERTFDTFIAELKARLAREGLSDIWPCFIVGKVGTDLHTTLFDTEVARSLTAKVRPLGSYIKGHYTDGVSNPQDYPLCGMGAANVGPEFTMSEYDGLAELERTEQKLLAEGRIAMRSRITETLERLVEASGRWKKWLLPAEEGSAFGALSAERRTWLVKTGCRYIWQEPEALVARQRLYDNLRRVGMDPEEVVLGRIEHDMDKYFYAFNLVDLNNLL